MMHNFEYTENPRGMRCINCTLWIPWNDVSYHLGTAFVACDGQGKSYKPEQKA